VETVETASVAPPARPVLRNERRERFDMYLP
jgi:hypothetical protein